MPVPSDVDFVCLTFGPTVFGAPEGRPAMELTGCGVTIYFKAPVAVDSHWRSDLGTFTINKLENTRFAIVASTAPQTGKSSENLTRYKAMHTPRFAAY